MRILYVEDNQANLFLVQRVARMGGHHVIAYDNGEQALANFNTDKPDLILMDVQLSGSLSGLDVVRRIRSQGHKMPVVAVTAYAMVGDRERCMEAGCDAYLSKPLPVTELVEIIRRYSGTALASAPTPATAVTETPAPPTATATDGAATSTPSAPPAASMTPPAPPTATAAKTEATVETKEIAPSAPSKPESASSGDQDMTEPTTPVDKTAAPESGEKKMGAAAAST